jgi:hypothetical protein
LSDDADAETTLYCSLGAAGQEMQALFFAPNGARNDTATGQLPTLPTSVNYPSYGSMALLDLEPPAYTAQVRLLLSSW